MQKKELENIFKKIEAVTIGLFLLEEGVLDIMDKFIETLEQLEKRESKPSGVKHIFPDLDNIF